MAKVVAGITMSVDGCITGPNDGPGKGLGFSQPWTWTISGCGSLSSRRSSSTD